jgi:hypothetical protein
MAARRIFKLRGDEPWMDRLAIMLELCREMTPAERFSALQMLIMRHNQGEFTSMEASAKLAAAANHAGESNG